MSKVIIAFLFLVYGGVLHSQTWTPKANFPGALRVNPTSFTINNTGYLVAGKAANNTMLKDLWEYDIINDTWTQKANFLGNNRVASIGVSLNGSGYVGIGWDGSSYFNDFYEYIPSVNAWVQRANYPGSGRRNNFAASSSVTNRIYVGGGSSSSDFWEYNPITDQWSLLSSNWPLGSRSGGVSFSIDSIIYFGMGHNGSLDFNDLWAYNLNTNLWSQIPSFSGQGRLHPSAFVFNNYVIVGGGYRLNGGTPLNDYYVLDLNSNTWSSLTAINTPITKLSADFHNGLQGIVAIGEDSNATLSDSTWSLNYLTSAIRKSIKDRELRVFPNPASDYISVENESNMSSKIVLYSIEGKVIFKKEKNDTLIRIELSGIKPGVYVLNCIFNESEYISKKLIIK